MKADIKTQWIEALRSGEYVQGRGKLHSFEYDPDDDSVIAGEEFCCLGVLCDLADKAGIVQAKRQGDEVLYDNHDAYLPPAVNEWAGIEDYNPAVGLDNRGVFPLTGLNDDGYTFGLIADLIEEQL